MFRRNQETYFFSTVWKLALRGLAADGLLLHVKPSPARPAVLGETPPTPHDFIPEIAREIGNHVAAVTGWAPQHFRLS
jgi:hypothetical protein